MVAILRGPHGHHAHDHVGAGHSHVLGVVQIQALLMVAPRAADPAAQHNLVTHTAVRVSILC